MYCEIFVLLHIGALQNIYLCGIRISDILYKLYSSDTYGLANMSEENARPDTTRPDPTPPDTIRLDAYGRRPPPSLRSCLIGQRTRAFAGIQTKQYSSQNSIQSGPVWASSVNSDPVAKLVVVWLLGAMVRVQISAYKILRQITLHRVYVRESILNFGQN